MAEKRIQDWLNTAVSGIRFKPDRAAVEQELRGHFEDKAADLQRFYHVSQEEAEEMALERMGNAEEIGREMAKIHKPWLGWLWQFSRALVIAAVVGITAVWLWWGDDAFLGDEPFSELWDFDGYPGSQNCDFGTLFEVRRRGAEEHYMPVDDPDQLMAKKGDQGVWVNGQHIALRHAAIWKEDGQENLYLSLRLETLLFWERGDFNIRWFQITDSEGKQYIADKIEMDVFNRYGGEGPFHRCVELVARDLDPMAEWVRLDYGPGKSIFSLVVELDRR